MVDKIKFDNFDDFYNRADEILSNFELVSLLPFFSLREYKNYVYGKNMASKYKDRIWEYLMGDIEKEDLIYD